MERYFCSICKKGNFNIKKLVWHLRNNHSMHLYGKNSLSCGQPGCALQFFTFSGFQKHLKIAHNDFNLLHKTEPTLAANSVNALHITDCVNTQCENIDTCNIPQEDSEMDAAVVSQTLITNNEVNYTADLILTSAKLKSIACNFISQLTTLNITDNAMDSVINASAELVTVTANSVNALLQCGQIDHLQNHLKDICGIFDSINSSYKRTKFFQDEMRIVPVTEINLGTKAVTRFDKNTGASKVILIPKTFIYVSIIDSLQFLLENKTLRNLIVNPQPINKQYLANYTDGLHCMSHDLFSKEKQSFKIIIYYDDFHVENALGSKKNKHKLGAIYFQLKNISPIFNSQQQHVHLISLFHATIVKEFGFDAVLHPLICDLKKLESSGIHIEGINIPVKGTIIAVSHDNLGANSLYGYTESFNSTYYCRFCYCTKNECKIITTETDKRVKLRTRASYTSDIQELENEATISKGLKRRCILNDLTYFHVTECPSVDCMHDILEGSLQLVIKLLVSTLIKERYVSLEEINSRIDAYPYGYLEQCNKPCAIKLDKKSINIGQKAAQAWCLGRFLPLILSNDTYIDERSKDLWHVFTSFLEIMSIIFSPKITVSLTYFLQELISEHLKLFNIIFPGNIIPKQHFLLHYPRIMRLMGPVVHMWTMRFESKHSFFTRIASNVCNFKNICKTLSTKHQRYFCNLWKTTDVFNKIEVGPGKLHKASELSMLQDLNITEDVHFLNWVLYCGIMYRQKFFVCFKIVNDLPIFCQIKFVVQTKDDIFLILSEWHTLSFSEQFQAYNVCAHTEEHDIICNLKELIYPQSYELHSPLGLISKMYIVPRYHIF